MVGTQGADQTRQMPTVLRASGYRVMIYANDHTPAHVHVIGPGWVVVVNLAPVEVREATAGCSVQETADIKRLIATHRKKLLTEWSRIHG